MHHPKRDAREVGDTDEVIVDSDPGDVNGNLCPRETANRYRTRVRSSSRAVNLNSGDSREDFGRMEPRRAQRLSLDNGRRNFRFARDPRRSMPTDEHLFVARLANALLLGVRAPGNSQQAPR